MGAMSTYKWGYNPLTKWDEPPSREYGNRPEGHRLPRLPKLWFAKVENATKTWRLVGASFSVVFAPDFVAEHG